MRYLFDSSSTEGEQDVLILLPELLLIPQLLLRTPLVHPGENALGRVFGLGGHFGRHLREGLRGVLLLASLEGRFPQTVGDELRSRSLHHFVLGQVLEMDLHVLNSVSLRFFQFLDQIRNEVHFLLFLSLGLNPQKIDVFFLLPHLLQLFFLVLHALLTLLQGELLFIQKLVHLGKLLLGLNQLELGLQALAQQVDFLLFHFNEMVLESIKFGQLLSEVGINQVLLLQKLTQEVVLGIQIGHANLHLPLVFLQLLDHQLIELVEEKVLLGGMGKEDLLLLLLNVEEVL